MRAGPPPYWITLVLVSPPTIPVLRDKQPSPPHVTELEYTSLAAKGALAHRMQRHTACKIKNSHQGAPKWPIEV